MKVRKKLLIIKKAGEVYTVEELDAYRVPAH
jgi:hypothetical protein